MAPGSAEAFGETLTWLMKRAKLQNRDVAAATGVDHTQVSKWRSGTHMPDEAKLRLIVDLMRSRGVETSVAELRHGPGATNGRVSEDLTIYQRSRAPEIGFESMTAAQRARHWLEGFLLELAESGAEQDFIDSSRRLLLNPSNYEHAFGAPAGTRDEMSDEQKVKHMQALAVGVREALKSRLKQLKGGRK